ncbi:restriction endonuclease subunit S [Janibacter anophelis]|uniref:restriction endonuclease subunit S n=1 Tax=Janibacter anophelis TaxID=319054 RepID=UPI003F7E9D64
MSELRQVTLGDICDKPTYGAIASGSDLHDGPLFVRQTDLSRGRIDWSSVPRCDLDSSQVLKYAIERDDILVSRLGTVGRSARVTETHGAVYAGYLVRFQVDRTQADPAFVAYQLQSPKWWAHVDASRSGAVQPTLNAKQMAAFEFDLPNMESQRAIAEVLGALDDKIAANTRLVSTLLQLTDAHFASAAAHSMLSDLTFADVADVGGGGTPKTKVEEYWGDEVDWATPTDVTALHGPYLRSTSRRITQAGLDNCSSALYPTGSILMTSRATIGAFAVAQSPMAVNQGFIVVNSKGGVPQWWLFHEMQRRVPEFVSHANGATFLELSRGKFKNFHVHLAATEVMQRFAETADALHSRSAAAETESASLAETRDALLPLLMSGKVTVKAAESVVEGVA